MGNLAVVYRDDWERQGCDGNWFFPLIAKSSKNSWSGPTPDVPNRCDCCDCRDHLTSQSLVITVPLTFANGGERGAQGGVIGGGGGRWGWVGVVRCRKCRRASTLFANRIAPLLRSVKSTLCHPSDLSLLRVYRIVKGRVPKWHLFWTEWSR